MLCVQANVKALGDSPVKDGEVLPLAVKDLGSCEIFPQTLAHNPNGRSAFFTRFNLKAFIQETNIDYLASSILSAYRSNIPLLYSCNISADQRTGI